MSSTEEQVKGRSEEWWGAAALHEYTPVSLEF
jgi:hypothetical protein